jgi:hypothetical protein
MWNLKVHYRFRNNLGHILNDMSFDLAVPPNLISIIILFSRLRSGRQSGIFTPGFCTTLLRGFLSHFPCMVPATNQDYCLMLSSHLHGIHSGCYTQIFFH